MLGTISRSQNVGANHAVFLRGLVPGGCGDQSFSVTCFLPKTNSKVRCIFFLQNFLGEILPKCNYSTLWLHYETDHICTMDGVFAKNYHHSKILHLKQSERVSLTHQSQGCLVERIKGGGGPISSIKLSN